MNVESVGRFGHGAAAQIKNPSKEIDAADLYVIEV